MEAFGRRNCRTWKISYGAVLMVDCARVLLPRREHVLAQVRDDHVLAVVRRADDRRAVLLMNIAKVSFELLAPFRNEPSQEDF